MGAVRTARRRGRAVPARGSRRTAHQAGRRVEAGDDRGRPRPPVGKLVIAERELCRSVRSVGPAGAQQVHGSSARRCSGAPSSW